MKKIAVLGSTNGTDFPSVFDSMKKFNAEICVVISDKKDSGILLKAGERKIDAVFIEPKDFASREEFDSKILSELKKRKIDLVVLIGYMKLISKEFLDAYKNKIMNIHPSLLPSFPGMNLSVHKEVLDYGCKISGATVFFVDEGKDSGPIILQKAVPVSETDSAESLKEKIQKAEQEIYPKAIKLFCENKLKVEGRKVKILE
ncbi:MAG: phosphoribosylglycinamide formyltransferase [archaeon]